jgi:hypothetical protein
MPGSHADDIVGEYFEGDEWAELEDAEGEHEPDPPIPPPG